MADIGAQTATKGRLADEFCCEQCLELIPNGLHVCQLCYQQGRPVDLEFLQRQQRAKGLLTGALEPKCELNDAGILGAGLQFFLALAIFFVMLYVDKNAMKENWLWFLVFLPAFAFVLLHADSHPVRPITNRALRAGWPVLQFVTRAISWLMVAGIVIIILSWLSPVASVGGIEALLVIALIVLWRWVSALRDVIAKQHERLWKLETLHRDELKHTNSLRRFIDEHDI